MDLDYLQETDQDLHLYNKPQTLKEFGFPEGYNRLPKVTFCGIVDCFK